VLGVVSNACSLEALTGNLKIGITVRGYTARRTFLPSTNVPLVEPRSCTCTPLAVAVTLACSDDTAPGAHTVPQHTPSATHPTIHRPNKLVLHPREAVCAREGGMIADTDPQRDAEYLHLKLNSHTEREKADFGWGR